MHIHVRFCFVLFVVFVSYFVVNSFQLAESQHSKDVRANIKHTLKYYFQQSILYAAEDFDGWKQNIGRDTVNQD